MSELSDEKKQEVIGLLKAGKKIDKWLKKLVSQWRKMVEKEERAKAKAAKKG